MSHFTQKYEGNIIGQLGGRKKKPEPAKLTPPNRDTAQDLLVSNGVLSTVDLISEGPIKGFTDINGYSVYHDTAELGYSIYLDGTPIFDTSGMQNFLRVAFQGKLGYSNQSRFSKADRPPMDYNISKNLEGPFYHWESAKEGTGSYDKRPYYSFTDWASGSNPSGATTVLAIPVTHVIKDKYCASFGITIGIQQLMDTSSTETKYGRPDPTLKDSGAYNWIRGLGFLGMPQPQQFPERSIW